MAAELDRSLSLAFMRGHPAQAARVLEALPPEEAAAAFARAPARLGAAVLAAMLPRRAALCVDTLDDERLQALLAAMGTQPTVALLRHLAPPRRQRLTAGLPTAAALATTLLLGYNEDTLGAWADPDVVLLPADTRAADALDRLRAATGSHATVFAADAERRLAGVVSAITLLQAPAAATLATLMERPRATLPAFAPLAAAADNPGWDEASALPVLEPGQRLVGVMTRDGLARALRQMAPAGNAEDATLKGLLAQGYWQALTGLLEGGLALLPRVPMLLPVPAADSHADSAADTRADAHADARTDAHTDAHADARAERPVTDGR